MGAEIFQRKGRLEFMGSTVLFAIFLTCSLLVPMAGAQTREFAGRRTDITAVIPFDSPPTYFQAPKTQKAAGFAVEVMDEIAMRAGLSVSYRFEHDWTAIVNAVRSGKADIAPGMGITEERQTLLAFTLPIDAIPVSLFSRSNDNTISGLRPGIKVGVITGSAAYEIIKKQGGNISFKKFEGFGAGLFDLLAGHIDVFCCPAPTLMDLARDAGVEDKIKIVGAPVMELKRGIALRKDDTELYAKLAAVTEAFVGSPQYQQIYTKWYGRRIPYFALSKQYVMIVIALTLIIIAMAAWRHQSLLGMNRRLRQSEAETKEAQNIAKTGRWELDLFNNSLQWSDTIFDIFEIDRTQFGATYEAFLETIHPDDREMVNKAYTDSLINKQPYAVTHRLIMKDGRVKWVSELCRTDYDQNGQATRSVGIVQDITERKRAEKKLIKSERQLRESQEVARLGNWDLDLASQTLEWSDQTYRLFDKDPKDFVPSFNEFARLVHPDDQATMQTNFNKALESDASPYHVAVRIINASGREWVMDAFGVVRRDPAGKALSIFGTAQDITDRRQAEDKIRQNEVKYRNLFDSSTDAIFIMDLNGNFIDANATAYTRLGYTKNELLALHISKLDHPEFARKVPDRMKQIHENGLAVFESANLRKDGTAMLVEVNSRLMEYEGRTVFFSMIRDITERKNAEKALHESEERYRILFDQSPEGILLIDMKGKILEFNDTAHRQLGYSREEFAKLRLSDIDPVESQEKIQAKIAQIRELGKAAFEVRHRTKQGDIRDVHVINQTMMLSGSPVVHTIWRDITESKRMERLLRESEERLGQAIRVSQIGIFDHEHRAGAVYWSPEQRKTYGWRAEETVSLPAFLECVYPEDRERIAAEVRRAHDPAGDGLFDIEHRITRRDNEVRWVSTRSRTYFEGEGDARRSVRTVGASVDITERKQMERSLKESEEKFRTLFASANDALFIIDMLGNILDTNTIAYKRLGYTKEELLSLHLSQVDAPPFAATISERMEHFKQHGRLSMELAHVRKNGSVMPVEVNASMIDINGEKVIFSAVRDITDRKNTEDALRRSHERLEALVKERTAELTMLNEQLRNLSVYLQNAREEERMKVARDVHDDLGQSLTAIKLGLASLRKKVPEKDKRIAEQAEYLAELIESTMQSVKRIAMELRPGMLDHIGLDSAIEWQAAEFTKRNGIPCTVDFEPEEIHLDRDRSTAVFRIFQETLTNVLRHANASNVEVLLKLQAGKLLLEVKDDGKGITEQQASDAMSMGLIGMRERVHSWGGSLSIQGIPDKGTTVMVKIPLDQPERVPQ